MEKLKNGTIYLLKEQGDFCMSLVVVAPDGEIIVIDGGKSDDAGYLYGFVGGRRVSAWIITHAHPDHICAVNSLLADDGKKLDIGEFIYRFPPNGFLWTNEPLYAPYQEEFLRLIREKGFKSVVPNEGDVIRVGKLTINIIMTDGPDCLSTALNDHSLVFRIDSPHHRALFPADLEPSGGDRLLEKTKSEPGVLSADIVQAAHHGHMSVDRRVYELIRPSKVLWCDPLWLYNEAPDEIKPRMYGNKTTRRWLSELGAADNYVSGEGTSEIPFD